MGNVEREAAEEPEWGLRHPGRRQEDAFILVSKKGRGSLKAAVDITAKAVQESTRTGCQH